MDNPDPFSAPILVPVDFSSHSESALLWALGAARRFSAPVHILHVVHDPEDAPGYYTRTGSDGHVQRLEECAREMLDEFLMRFRRDHPTEVDPNEAQTDLVVGLPSTRILEFAERIDAQLIVMGSQGRTGLAHMMLGSKAERVVRLSTIPVTIVKAR